MSALYNYIISGSTVAAASVYRKPQTANKYIADKPRDIELFSKNIAEKATRENKLFLEDTSLSQFFIVVLQHVDQLSKNEKKNLDRSL